MRGRPVIAYELSPSELVPGAKLTVTLVLMSDGETPFDKIDVILRGRERSRDHAKPFDVPTHDMRLERRLTGGVLAQGVHRLPVEFDLPADLAPSYISELSDTVYELDVHVDIPWWPDARETFTVRASPHPATTVRAPPLLQRTHASPTTGVLYVEAAIASPTLVVGEKLVGALSLASIGKHRVSAIELVVHSIETSVVSSSSAPVVAERWVTLVKEGAPDEGEVVPFEVTVPDHITPTFTSRFVKLTHELRVRVAVTLGEDVVLAMPVEILARGALPARRADDAKGELPAVGRTAFTERLERAATRLRERRGLRASVRGSALTITRSAEASGAGASERTARVRAKVDGERARLVAELAWPPIGIDLSIEDRGAFGGASDVVGLPPRFTFLAREPHQLRAVVHGPLVAALAPFRRVRAKDDTGRFSVDASGRGDAFIDAFIDDALALDAELATAAARVPYPTALEHLGPRFEALASAWGATLRRGDMSLEGFAPQGIEMAVRHVFAGAAPRERVVEARLPPGTELPVDVGTKLHAQMGAKVGPGDTVVVVLDPGRDPGELEQIVGRLSAALRKLAPGTRVGPYR